MARTSGYRRSAVWRPCGVTVMKLHGSDNRGGITVKRLQRALAHIYNYDETNKEKLGKNETPHKRQVPCCESYGKHIKKVRNASATNKARERWNNKGEINNGPTAGNGVEASSLEIRTGNFSKSVTLWTSNPMERNQTLQRDDLHVWLLSCLWHHCPRPLTFSVRSRGISHSKWRWFWNDGVVDRLFRPFCRNKRITS